MSQIPFRTGVFLLMVRPGYCTMSSNNLYIYIRKGDLEH